MVGKMTEINLKDDDDGNDIGDIQELSEEKKAQIKMTYWVLGGIAILFIGSAAAYIFTDNGVEGYLSDVQEICSVSTPSHSHVVEFCRKYMSSAISEANAAAKAVFEFFKNFLPPIVTLVLGAHYVTKSNQND